jgi:hypothetical protein
MVGISQLNISTLNNLSSFCFHECDSALKRSNNTYSTNSELILGTQDTKSCKKEKTAHSECNYVSNHLYFLGTCWVDHFHLALYKS